MCICDYSFVGSVATSDICAEVACCGVRLDFIVKILKFLFLRLLQSDIQNKLPLPLKWLYDNENYAKVQVGNTFSQTLLHNKGKPKNKATKNTNETTEKIVALQRTRIICVHAYLGPDISLQKMCQKMLPLQHYFVSSIGIPDNVYLSRSYAAQRLSACLHIKPTPANS